MTVEIWKPIPRTDGEFEASNLGRIRRLYAGGAEGWRIMKPTPHRGGSMDKDRQYLTVNLSRKGERATGKRHVKGDNPMAGKQRQFAVHCLVLEAFVGPRPSPDHHGCHGLGGPQDNSLANLRWDTKEENWADIVRHGTRQGEFNGRAKLTQEDVIELRRFIRGGGYRRGIFKELGEKYGVHQRMISYAVYGRCWQNITEEPPVEYDAVTQRPAV